MSTSWPGATLSPIGTIATPYRQKFAIPRQPNLVDAKGVITMHETVSAPAVFKGIEHFSHLWLLFLFHQTAARGWKPAVKAPRLGGNATLGVFASRSTHRPNALGMSVVRNLGWQQTGKTLSLTVGGVDLLDGTPIVDIKPYIPYADHQQEATDTLTDGHPTSERPVTFSHTADKQVAAAAQRHAGLRELICGILAQDPRPAYRQKLEQDEREYHVALYDLDVHWRVSDGAVEVLRLTPLP